MDPVPWTADEPPVVGVVADGDGDADSDDNADERGRSGSDLDEAITSVVADRDGSSVVAAPGRLEDVLAAGPSFLVVVGGRAASAVVRADVDRPVLPAGVDPAIDAASRDDLPDALEAVLDGRAIERRRPVLSVTVDAGRHGAEATEGGDTGVTERSGARADVTDRALFDVTLATAEPARISEYAVASRGERVARFRADGVVVATPAGTRGYAGAVSAPELSPAVAAVAVSPIAPFVMHANRWVLPDDDLSLSIERDEATISVSVDGRTVATVGPEARVDIEVDASLSTFSVPDGPYSDEK